MASHDVELASLRRQVEEFLRAEFRKAYPPPGSPEVELRRQIVSIATRHATADELILLCTNSVARKALFDMADNWHATSDGRGSVVPAGLVSVAEALGA